MSDTHTTNIYGTDCVMTFPSYSAFIAHNRQNVNKSLDRDLASKVTYNDDFAGLIPSISDACNLAATGLPADGIAALDAVRLKVDGIKQRLNAPQFVPYLDTAGSFVDMGRFVTGEPECMVNYVLDRAPSVETVVPIAVNMAVLGKVPTEDIAARGRAIVAIIEAIQTVGRNVELWADMSSTGGWGTTAGTSNSNYLARFAIMLKPADQPLDTGALMYAMTHASFFRALGFNTRHTLPSKWQNALDVGFGYGRTVKGSKSVERDYPAGTLYIPALQPGDDVDGLAERVLTNLGILDA